MKVLITGHTGFIGTNLRKCLREEYGDNIQIVGFNTQNRIEDLDKLVEDCDFIFELAAVHRPKDTGEFEKVNVGILEVICDLLQKKDHPCPILYVSSIQSGNDSPYGKSKKQAEDLLLAHSAKMGSDAYVYRLTNVFGPGARPNGHSVVATFCYNLAKGLPIRIDDENHKIVFCYVGDVVKMFADSMAGRLEKTTDSYYDVADNKKYTITVGQLAKLLKDFSKYASENKTPLTHDLFEDRLWETYLYYTNT